MKNTEIIRAKMNNRFNEMFMGTYNDNLEDM